MEHMDKASSEGNILILQMESTATPCYIELKFVSIHVNIGNIDN